MTPHVAVLIPSAGQRALANLARDAIAKFTQDVSHEVWLLDTAPDLAHGSEANGRALNRMIQALWRNPLGHPLTHVFYAARSPETRHGGMGRVVCAQSLSSTRLWGLFRELVGDIRL